MRASEEVGSASSSAPTPASTTGPIEDLTGSSNPYLAIRADRADRWALARRTLERLWLALAGALVLVLVLIAVLAWHAGGARAVPWVVEVGAEGEVVAVERLETASRPSRVMVQHALRLWVLNVRTVTSDRAAQRRLILDAYEYTGGRGVGLLNGWFAENPPFARANRETVTPRVTSLLAIGGGEEVGGGEVSGPGEGVWQIHWVEVRHGASGAEVGRAGWRALLTVEVAPPRGPEPSLVNPLGIRVVDFDWTPVAGD